MKAYRVRIKVVSPLHVGTGEVYEPTTFFVDQSRQELCVLDFEALCTYLTGSQLERFQKLCTAGTLEALVKLYDFMDRTCLDLLRQGIDGFVRRRIALCEGFVQHYQRVKGLSGQQLHREFNKFHIQRTSFSPNENGPIIPGSAIKGAIRTAVLNLRRHRARSQSWQDYCRGRRCDSKQLESEILEYPKTRFNQDPFRLVKVSDFRPVGEVQTKIIYAVNRKKNGRQARGPYQILEVIEPGAVFEGEIAILRPLRGARGTQSIQGEPLAFEEIRKALAVFYGQERDREGKEIEQIDASFPAFPEGAFPLRVGRHSGGECVTIEGFRHIFIKGKRGRDAYQEHATTLWLASEFYNPKNNYGLKPLGWAALYEADKEPRPAREKQAEPKSKKVDLSKLTKNPNIKIVIKKK